MSYTLHYGVGAKWRTVLFYNVDLLARDAVRAVRAGKEDVYIQDSAGFCLWPVCDGDLIMDEEEIAARIREQP